MSEQNKAIVEKANTAFSEGKTEDFLAQCTEDFVWTMVGEKTTKGKGAVREWMASMEGKEPPKFTVDKMISDDDSAVCYGDMTMKGKDGVEGKYSYCDIYEFSGDQIAKLASFVVKHKAEGEKAAAG